MLERLLIVEDDHDISHAWAAYFRRHGWEVDTAANGREALACIESANPRYDCLILDLRMPQLDGEDFLELLNNRSSPRPPVIVVSAYLDQLSATNCVLLEAKCVLTKPVRSVLLLAVATALVSGDRQALEGLLDDAALGLRQILPSLPGGPISNLPPSEALQSAGEHAALDERVKAREKVLEAYFARQTQGGPRSQGDEPVLVIGRRWNSWYPSFFDVPGGAYCLVGPRSSTGEAHYAVIDPGFRFLKVLGDLGLSVAHMDSCIITHNHPDHLGGVFEFLAARHTVGRSTALYCNPSSRQMLQTLAGDGLDVRELGDNNVDLMDYDSAETEWVRVKAKGIRTAHDEIGVTGSASQAVLITCNWGHSRDDLPGECGLAILGDTEYARADHRERFMSFLVGPTTRVVVLHIGCSQQKRRTGKHLYLPGLRRILTDIEAEWEATRCQGRLCVLVSEWGLEHATEAQIARICGGTIDGFGPDSPILETIDLLRGMLERIDLIPADIGLTVGLRSGQIYLEDGSRIEPEALRWTTTDAGLAYHA